MEVSADISNSDQQSDPLESNGGGDSFVCFICNAKFSCQIYLNRHLKNIHEETNEEHRKCPKCPMIFKRYDTFWEHIIRVHETPSSTVGGDAPEDMGSTSNLVTANDDDLIVIPDDENELEALLESWISETDEQMCKRCGKTFCDRRNVKRHIKEVHLKLPATKGGTRAECKICNKTFVNNSVYNAHMRNIHLKPEPTIPCPKCWKKFKENKGLTRHMKEVHLMHTEVKTVIVESTNANDNVLFNCKSAEVDGEDVIFSCKTCEISFVTVDALNRHKKNVHRINVHSGKPAPASRKPQLVVKREFSALPPDSGEEHTCTECRKKFSSKNALWGHAVVHQKASLDPHVKGMLKAVFGTICSSSLTCGLCGTVVTNSIEGRLHVYIKHPEKFEELVTKGVTESQGLLQCTYCSEKQPSSEAMMSHIESFHPDKHIPTCPLCGRKELKERDINLHFKQFHPQASRYCCDICKRTFNQRRGLEHHVSREHSANSVQCPYCPEKHVKVKLHVRVKHPEKAEEYTQLKNAAIREEQEARLHFNRYLEKGPNAEVPRPRMKRVSKKKSQSKKRINADGESDLEDDFEEETQDDDVENPEYIIENDNDEEEQKTNVCYMKETPKVTMPELYTLQKNTNPHLIEVHRLPSPPTPPPPEQMDFTPAELSVINTGEVKPDISHLEAAVVIDREQEQTNTTTRLPSTEKTLILRLVKLSEQEIASWTSKSVLRSCTDESPAQDSSVEIDSFSKSSLPASVPCQIRKRRRRR